MTWFIAVVGNGRLNIKSTYKDDKRESEWLYYNEDGQLEKTEIYKDGKERV